MSSTAIVGARAQRALYRGKKIKIRNCLTTSLAPQTRCRGTMAASARTPWRPSAHASAAVYGNNVPGDWKRDVPGREQDTDAQAKFWRAGDALRSTTASRQASEGVEVRLIARESGQGGAARAAPRRVFVETRAGSLSARSGL